MPGNIDKVDYRTEYDQHPTGQGACGYILNACDFPQCLFQMSFYTRGAVQAGNLKPGTTTLAAMCKPDTAITWCIS